MVTFATKFLILYSIKEMNLLHWNFELWSLGREFKKKNSGNFHDILKIKPTFFMNMNKIKE
jgi:hypothetical protein